LTNHRTRGRAGRVVAACCCSALLLLAACGGGGAEAPPPPPAALVPEAGTLIVKDGARFGAGTLDGTGTGAGFDTPSGLAAAPDGGVFVADTLNGMIRHATPEGVVTTRCGKRNERAVIDGPPGVARFRFPTRMAIANDGTLYVVDRAGTERPGGILRAIGRDGVVSTVPGTEDVYAVAADKDGSLVLVIGHAVFRRLPDGALSLVAGSRDQPGLADGLRGEARFSYPTDVAIKPDGVIYVAAGGRLPRILPTGEVVSRELANADPPNGLAVDPDGTVWYVPWYGEVTKFDEPGRPCGPQCRRDVSQVFDFDLAFIADGRAIVASRHKLTWANREMLAGVPSSPTVTYPQQLETVRALDVDLDGNTVALYVSPSARGSQLRRLDATGQKVWEMAPPNPPEFLNGVALDPLTGTLYGLVSAQSDREGSGLYRIDQNGQRSAVAEWPGASSPAVSAGPIVAGRDGALYFLDFANGDVMRWTPAQGISLVLPRTGYASTPFQQYQHGTGNPMPEARPHALAADRQGTVYFVFEGGLLRIRGGRAEPLVPANTFTNQSWSFTNVTVDHKDRVFVSDREVIYEVLPDGSRQVRAGEAGSIGFRPGPLPGSLGQITAMVAGADGTLHVFGDNQLAVLRID
jgi:sugar lactone lactonase YvrE